MPQLDPHIFRAYDIRGKVDSQITEEACLWIGKAFGSVVREMYGMDHPTIAVGRDARTHGPKFEKAMIDGLVSAGCHVINIGQTPSPINYFTICDREIDGSMQITASHNPKDDNGVKLQVRNAQAYSGDDLQKLYKKIEQEDVLTGEGSVEESDAITPYLNHLSQMFAGAGDGMKIVIDSGNGVAGPVYQEALMKVGAEVTGLFIEPDGTFPNHPADPSKHETLVDLQASVKEVGADIGLAFDGDGDRLGVVDENGEIRTADEIILLLAKDHLSRHPGKSVIFTVSNSSTLETEITKWGGKPIMTVVGHSFVEHAMVEHNALLGGGQTFGMRAFKHTVTDQYKSLDWKQALLWSMGSTVSILTLGATSFLLDSLCQTTTITNAHHYWKFSQITSTDKETAPDLLQLIEEESTVDEQKIAA